MHKQARAASVSDLAAQLCPSVCGLRATGALSVSGPASWFNDRANGVRQEETERTATSSGGRAVCTACRLSALSVIPPDSANDQECRSD